jgi:hypothetical protein
MKTKAKFCIVALSCFTIMSFVSSWGDESDLVWSTYLGGSSVEYGYDICIDDLGCIYITGHTSSIDFPTTAGVFDPSINGNKDAFIAKLNSSGTFMEYATYLGSDDNDQGRSITVDDFGYAYVTGATYSPHFPTTPGAFDTTHNAGTHPDYDAFVTKINPTGSILVFSTFLGGTGGDCGLGIVVDDSGYSYVTGGASSLFPTTYGAFDTTHNGESDAFVTKLNPLGSDLVYSTLIGGGKDENGQGISLDNSGCVYVVGETGSDGFPATPQSFDTTYNGGGTIYGYDAFVAKLNPSGSDLVYSTFLGGSDTDEGHDIAVNSSGEAYATGDTKSSDFPTTAESFDPIYNGGSDGDAFIVKLNIIGSVLSYSTYLGGTNSDNGNSIAVDAQGEAYVTGHTTSSDFPTTPEAFDMTINGIYPDYDAFVSKINSTGSDLDYSTFLGGGDYDYGQSIALDNLCNANLIGYTRSLDFPTTLGTFDETANGSYDVFVTNLSLYPTPLINLPINYHTFIDVSVGDQEQWSFNIRNAGNADLTIFNILNSNPEFFTLAEPTSFPVIISEFDSIAASVIFHPTDIDSFECTLFIASDASNSDTIGVYLNGNSIDSSAPESIDDLMAFLDNGSKKSYGGNIFLSWSEPFDNIGISHYVIYRSEEPNQLGDSLASTTTETYLDLNVCAIGHPYLHNYYTVKAVDYSGNKSEGSNRVGEFDKVLRW